MRFAGKVLGVFFMVFIVYVVFSGSVSVTGVIVALVTSLITANLVISNPGKLIQVRRFGWLLAYSVRYFFVDEVKAHLDVMKRILHPKMPINPGIVKIPYEVVSDYAMLTIANSITNTPGTVVVEVFPEEKAFYVHWINAVATEPTEVRKRVSEVFERFAKRIFD
ncbi:MAG: Na+/H+ antiporter subunit E [Desulfurococcaceae archaeon TW002]